METENSNAIAIEFISYCRSRCQSGWPELYDEMCWVASQRLFHNMGYSELRQSGLSFAIDDIENTLSIVNMITNQDNDTQTLSSNP
jgi:hypothetical protein